MDRINDAKRYQNILADAAEAQQAQFMKQLHTELALAFANGKNMGLKSAQQKFLAEMEQKMKYATRICRFSRTKSQR